MISTSGLFGPYPISRRELSVLEYASLGLKDQEICDQLGIASGTLGTYWARIKSKTGIQSRTRLSAEFASDKVRRTLCLCLRLMMIDWLSARNRHESHLVNQVPLPLFMLKDFQLIMFLNSTAKLLITTTDSKFSSHFSGWNTEEVGSELSEDYVSVFEIEANVGQFPGSFQALCLAMDSDRTQMLVALMPREPRYQALVATNVEV